MDQHNNKKQQYRIELKGFVALVYYLFSPPGIKKKKRKENGISPPFATFTKRPIFFFYFLQRRTFIFFCNKKRGCRCRPIHAQSTRCSIRFKNLCTDALMSSFVVREWKRHERKVRDFWLRTQLFYCRCVSHGTKPSRHAASVPSLRALNRLSIVQSTLRALSVAAISCSEVVSQEKRSPASSSVPLVSSLGFVIFRMVDGDGGNRVTQQQSGRCRRFIKESIQYTFPFSCLPSCQVHWLVNWTHNILFLIQLRKTGVLSCLIDEIVTWKTSECQTASANCLCSTSIASIIDVSCGRRRLLKRSQLLALSVVGWTGRAEATAGSAHLPISLIRVYLFLFLFPHLYRLSSLFFCRTQVERISLIFSSFTGNAFLN